MSGEDIRAEIKKRRGTKPSPGTIYPALKSLKEACLIKEKKEGKTITYSLTPEGKHGLKFAKQQFCQTFVGVFEP